MLTLNVGFVRLARGVFFSNIPYPIRSMSNPYRSPSSTHYGTLAPNEVRGPAIALMVVSLIAIVFGVLGLAGDVFLVLFGVVDHLEEINDGPTSKYTQIIVRTIWGIILLIASSFVFFGALKMKNMTDYGTARTAAIVAMIPLVGPCCLLGIPFGIWAYSILSRPHVKDAFR